MSSQIPNTFSHSISHLTCCPMSDCAPPAPGRDVPGRAERAAGPSEGCPANGAAGETGANSGGEAEQEAAAAGADGHHQPPHEGTGTGYCRQVRNKCWTLS